MFMKLKYQRNEKSSSSTIVTSRCFAEPWIPIDIDDLIFHAAKIHMTYIDQAIPSPPKLPSFETANHLSPSTYMNQSITTEAADATGDRVDNYARIAKIASTVLKLRKLIPREGTQFEFMNQDHARAMDKLELPSRLKKIRIKSFQKWEGVSIRAWACSSIILRSFGWEIDRNAPY